MFNINEFVSEINSHGIVKPSNYVVRIHRTHSPDINVEQTFKMRCSSVELPGRVIQTIDKKYYGPSFKVGYDSQFTEVPMTILLSEDWREKEYFEQWQDKIVGNYRTIDGPATNMFDIGYYDDYIGKVEIHSYNDVGEKKYSVELYEAYPTVVGSVQLNHSSGNEVAFLPISMSFKYTKKIK